MMSKRIRKSRWSTVEFYFPELLIQRIQSFLTSKEAARTTLLSKPWRRAWLTRPNLDFDHADFRQGDSYVLAFAEKTIKRYENSNLNIDSFRLSMKHPGDTATKLIHYALKLGPTHLTFQFDYGFDFDIPDVVFRYKNLVSLTAKGCRINLNPNELCWLRFLSLENVTIKRHDMNFSMLMNSCPLIERLSLCNVSHSFQMQDVNPHSLKSLVLKDENFDTGSTHLTFQFAYCFEFDIPDVVFRYKNLVSLTAKGCRINLNPKELCCSRLRFLSLENVTIKSRDMNFSMLMNSCPLIEKLSLCNVGHSFQMQDVNPHRLKSLVLKDENFDTGFLADLSFRFPSLKDLTLSVTSRDLFRPRSIIKDREEMLISSLTLERLDIGIRGHIHRVKLDIPSIRKLTFEYYSIPKLHVRSNSRGWESSLSIARGKCLSASWFKRLSNFLNKLRFSRISLSLHLSSLTTFNYEPGEIRGLPMPEIENLDIYHQYLPTQSCYVFFDGLFRMCHPQVITQYTSNVWEANNIDFLGKRLLDVRDTKVSKPNQFMYGLNDLKEVRVQVFDAAVSTWRDITLESLLEEYSRVNPQGYYPLHRFQLNWKL